MTVSKLVNQRYQSVHTRIPPIKYPASRSRKGLLCPWRLALTTSLNNVTFQVGVENISGLAETYSSFC